MKEEKGQRSRRMRRRVSRRKILKDRSGGKGGGEVRRIGEDEREKEEGDEREGGKGKRRGR